MKKNQNEEKHYTYNSFDSLIKAINKNTKTMSLFLDEIIVGEEDENGNIIIKKENIKNSKKLKLKNENDDINNENIEEDNADKKRTYIKDGKHRKIKSNTKKKSLGTKKKSNDTEDNISNLTDSIDTLSESLEDEDSNLGKISNNFSEIESKLENLNELSEKNTSLFGFMLNAAKETASVTKDVAVGLTEYTINQMQVPTVFNPQEDINQFSDSLSKVLGLGMGGPVGSYGAALMGTVAKNTYSGIKGLFNKDGQSNVEDQYYSDIPEYDRGGVVPGKKGKKRLVIAHAGETILPTHKESLEDTNVEKLLEEVESKNDKLNEYKYDKKIKKQTEKKETPQEYKFEDNLFLSKLDILIELQTVSIKEQKLGIERNLIRIGDILNYGNDIFSTFMDPIKMSIKDINKGIKNLDFSFKGFIKTFPSFIIKDVLFKVLGKDIFWKLLIKNIGINVIGRGILWEQLLQPIFKDIFEPGTVGKMLFGSFITTNYQDIGKYFGNQILNSIGLGKPFKTSTDINREQNSGIINQLLNNYGTPTNKENEIPVDLSLSNLLKLGGNKLITSMGGVAPFEVNKSSSGQLEPNMIEKVLSPLSMGNTAIQNMINSPGASLVGAIGGRILSDYWRKTSDIPFQQLEELRLIKENVADINENTGRSDVTREIGPIQSFLNFLKSDYGMLSSIYKSSLMAKDLIKGVTINPITAMSRGLFSAGSFLKNPKENISQGVHGIYEKLGDKFIRPFVGDNIANDWFSDQSVKMPPAERTNVLLESILNILKKDYGINDSIFKLLTNWSGISIPVLEDQSEILEDEAEEKAKQRRKRNFQKFTSMLSTIFTTALNTATSPLKSMYSGIASGTAGTFIKEIFTWIKNKIFGTGAGGAAAGGFKSILKKVIDLGKKNWKVAGAVGLLSTIGYLINKFLNGDMEQQDISSDNPLLKIPTLKDSVNTETSTSTPIEIPSGTSEKFLSIPPVFPLEQPTTETATESIRQIHIPTQDITFPYNTIPQFAEGGVVPGPVGIPQLAIVHGGETVIPVNQVPANTSQLPSLSENVSSNNIKKSGKFKNLKKAGGFLTFLIAALEAEKYDRNEDEIPQEHSYENVLKHYPDITREEYEAAINELYPKHFSTTTFAKSTAKNLTDEAYEVYASARGVQYLGKKALEIMPKKILNSQGIKTATKIATKVGTKTGVTAVGSALSGGLLYPVISAGFGLYDAIVNAEEVLGKEKVSFGDRAEVFVGKTIDSLALGFSDILLESFGSDNISTIIDKHNMLNPMSWIGKSLPEGELISKKNNDIIPEIDETTSKLDILEKFRNGIGIDLELFTQEDQEEIKKLQQKLLKETINLYDLSSDQINKLYLEVKNKIGEKSIGILSGIPMVISKDDTGVRRLSNEYLQKATKYYDLLVKNILFKDDPHISDVMPKIIEPINMNNLSPVSVHKPAPYTDYQRMKENIYPNKTPIMPIELITKKEKPKSAINSNPNQEIYDSVLNNPIPQPILPKPDEQPKQLDVTLIQQVIEEAQELLDIGKEQLDKATEIISDPSTTQELKNKAIELKEEGQDKINKAIDLIEKSGIKQTVTENAEKTYEYGKEKTQQLIDFVNKPEVYNEYIQSKNTDNLQIPLSDKGTEIYEITDENYFNKKPEQMQEPLPEPIQQIGFKSLIDKKGNWIRDDNPLSPTGPGAISEKKNINQKAEYFKSELSNRFKSMDSSALNFETKDGKLDYNKLQAYVKQNEGFVPAIYGDSKNINTIGYGHQIVEGDPFVPGVNYSKAELEEYFQKDFSNAIQSAKKIIPNFDKLNPNQQAALIDMSFNMGSVTKFKKMIDAISVGDYESASVEVLDSGYRTDVKEKRAYRNAALISMNRLKDGTFNTNYENDLNIHYKDDLTKNNQYVSLETPKTTIPNNNFIEELNDTYDLSQPNKNYSEQLPPKSTLKTVLPEEKKEIYNYFELYELNQPDFNPTEEGINFVKKYIEKRRLEMNEPSINKNILDVNEYNTSELETIKNDLLASTIQNSLADTINNQTKSLSNIMSSNNAMNAVSLTTNNTPVIPINNNITNNSTNNSGGTQSPNYQTLMPLFTGDIDMMF